MDDGPSLAALQQSLRTALRTFRTGVTVVTTVSDDGIPVGFTANSFTSVSMDPPLVLVCPALALSSIEVFNHCAFFAINILADSQREVSEIFAGPHDDRFGAIAWRPDAGGSPLIDGCAASLSCRTTQRVPGGDHVILIGQVEAVSAFPRVGLEYENGGYRNA